MGDLHSKDLIQLHNSLRGKPACPEETASGLHAGEHRHTHVPADRGSRREMRERQEKTNSEKGCTGGGGGGGGNSYYSFWSACRQGALQLDSCMT